jgi:phage tail protein X
MSIYKTIHLNEIDAHYTNAVLNECIEALLHLNKGLASDVETVFEILNK